METENEQAQAVEQAEQATTTPTEETLQDDVVTLSKGEFSKMNRKAIAYDTLKKAPPVTTKESDPEIVNRLSKIEQIEAKRQFGFENSLSPEETDWIFKSTGGKPSKEDLGNPFIKAGLEGYRQSKRVENNTPGTSSKGFLHTGKTFADLSEPERKAAFEEDMAKRRGK
jgi:hypothetical protein